MPKILIVEDNQDNWEILSRRLRRRGYDVVIARDGKQGLTMAKSDKPDLVLMDMNLPLLDGWEATRLFKGTKTGKQTPVIALTAHALTGDREKALEAGCDDYHTKPVELPRLLEQIEEQLRKRAAALAAAAANGAASGNGAAGPDSPAATA